MPETQEQLQSANAHGTASGDFKQKETAVSEITSYIYLYLCWWKWQVTSIKEST